jgi:hypothetical protein
VSSAAAPPAASLPDDVAAFIQGGVSITVASRDERLVPSIAKALGCHVGEGGREVTVLMFAPAAEAVARDIARHGRAAVVFSRPSTNKTVQLKGRDVRSVPVRPGDVAIVRRYLALFADDLQTLGWGHDYVDGVFRYDPGQLVAIRFTPEGAFLQTPGPGAGAAMELKPGALR